MSSNCLICYSKPINDTFMRYKFYPSNYYLTEGTDSCYDKAVDNYYLVINDKKLKRCHPNCLSYYSSQINETFMNCIWILMIKN